MEKVRLIRPGMDYAGEISAFRQELLEADDHDDFAGCGGLKKFEDPADWIEYCRMHSSPDTCPEDRVPGDVYLTVREGDDKIVGVVNLRHGIEHSPVLRTWGGHIGYSVRPSERRKGYGKEQLRLCLEKAGEIGLKRVLVACHDGNTASERTILSCGGVYESSVEVNGETIKRFWIAVSSQ